MRQRPHYLTSQCLPLNPMRLHCERCGVAGTLAELAEITCRGARKRWYVQKPPYGAKSSFQGVVYADTLAEAGLKARAAFPLEQNLRVKRDRAYRPYGT